RSTIKNSENHPFPKNGRDNRNPVVNNSSFSYPKFYATILRPPPFRNIHSCNNLDAGDQCVTDRDRKTEDLMEYTIHAITHDELILRGLNVDVARACFN